MQKILIVDDDPAIREILAEGLSDEYATESAPDGLEAMALIIKQKPSVIILDFNMNMPQLHGISVVEHILSRPENQAIKFILISGYLDAEQLKRWKDLVPGAQFFIKPFSLADIKAAIRTVLAT